MLPTYSGQHADAAPSIDQGRSRECRAALRRHHDALFPPGACLRHIAVHVDGIDMGNGKQGSRPARLIIVGAGGELQGLAEALVEEYTAAPEQLCQTPG